MAGRAGAAHAASRRQRPGSGRQSEPAFGTARPRVRTSNESLNLKDKANLDPDTLAFTPLVPLAYAAYLDAYGYEASGPKSWKVTPCTDSSKSPQITLGIPGHEEVDGHTKYFVECSLSIPSFPSLSWKVKRRLSQLREHFHSHIKTELGEKTYDRVFGEARFASHGGLPGTTSRLDNWFSALAACINRGQAPPSVIAIVLHFLEAPPGEADRDREVDDDDVCLQIEDPTSGDDQGTPAKKTGAQHKRLPSAPSSVTPIKADAPAPRTMSRSPSG